MCLGIITLTLFVSSIGIAFAANYSSTLNKVFFSATLKVDRQTQINDQYCQIMIQEVFQENAILSKTDDFSTYTEEMIEPWGTKVVYTSRDDLAYYSRLNKEASLGFSWMGSSNYLPFKGGVNSLELTHFAMPNFRGYGQHYAQANYKFDTASVGEISFDALILLNATLPASESEPMAKLTVKLGHADVANTESLELFFETIAHSAENNYTMNGFFNGINPTTSQKDVKTQLFQSNMGNFNWINVKIFFDVFNDVYNVTMQQYRMDEGFLGVPVSTVIRGQQYDANTWTRDYHGRRISTTQLINSISFLLESKAIGDEMGNARSSVFIDNFQAKMAQFPAVYADVQYQNATLTNHAYMNRTAISSISPPKYPSNTTLLGDLAGYMEKAESGDIYTNWPCAPSWIYSFPLVMSDTDHEKNIQTLLYYINNKANPIETMGILQPDEIGYYKTGAKGGPLSNQNFTYSKEDSANFDYWFVSASSNNIIRAEYYADEGIGIIKRIGIYPESVKNEANAILLVDYVKVGGDINDIAGFELFFMFMAVGIISSIMWAKKRRQ